MMDSRERQQYWTMGFPSALQWFESGWTDSLPDDDDEWVDLYGPDAFWGDQVPADSTRESWYWAGLDFVNELDMLDDEYELYGRAARRQ